MTEYAPYIVVSILSYFIGSISFGVIFSKKFGGFDVREKGSKGAGTTNVLRTVGKKAAILTLICDILKGVIAVLLGMMIAKTFFSETVNDTGVTLIMYLAGLFAIFRTYFPNILWISRRKRCCNSNRTFIST